MIDHCLEPDRGPGAEARFIRKRHPDRIRSAGNDCRACGAGGPGMKYGVHAARSPDGVTSQRSTDHDDPEQKGKGST